MRGGNSGEWVEWSGVFSSVGRGECRVEWGRCVEWGLRCASLLKLRSCLRIREGGWRELKRERERERERQERERVSDTLGSAKPQEPPMKSSLVAFHVRWPACAQLPTDSS